MAETKLKPEQALSTARYKIGTTTRDLTTTSGTAYLIFLCFR